MYKIIQQNVINDHIQHDDQNAVVFSVFNHLDCAIRSDIYSIKYVKKGLETYTVNGESYCVNSGEYLLVNGRSEGRVLIDDNKPVEGICININPRTIAEVVSSYIQPNTDYTDDLLGNFFNTADISQRHWGTKQTQVGIILQELDLLLSKDPFKNHVFTEEWYFSFTEKLVIDQQPLLGRLKSVPSLKKSTKQYLLKNILLAKDYIDHSFTKPLTIEEVAKQVNMSEFHFFRVFKATMHMTPYQYIITKRLELAKQLLKKKSMSVSEISIYTGFSDIFSFSRAFKKYFGVSPSQF